MAVESKDQVGPSLASITNTSTDMEATATKVVVSTTSSEPNTNSNDIIYTPPEAGSNMAPSLGENNASSPAPSSTNPPAPPTSNALSSSPAQAPTGASSNISKREYIYFLPYPLPAGTEIPYSIHLPSKNPLNLPAHQFEPTSTLVLTSPLRTFIDMRICKPLDAANQGSRQPLDWAFAGTSSSVPIAARGWKDVTHATWTHWLDSRFCVGDGGVPVDEGDMYPVAEDLTLEVGHAFHPALGAVSTHEEMWRDEAVRSIEAERGTKTCVVLRCCDDAARVRGVVLRVGQYVQGVLMQGRATTAERWEWDGEAAQWRRTVRVGDGFLPCAVCFRSGILAVGGKVRFHEFEWAVEEVWEWE